MNGKKEGEKTVIFLYGVYNTNEEIVFFCRV